MQPVHNTLVSRVGVKLKYLQPHSGLTLSLHIPRACWRRHLDDQRATLQNGRVCALPHSACLVGGTWARLHILQDLCRSIQRFPRAFGSQSMAFEVLHQVIRGHGPRDAGPWPEHSVCMDWCICKCMTQPQNRQAAMWECSLCVSRSRCTCINNVSGLQ